MGTVQTKLNKIKHYTAETRSQAFKSMKTCRLDLSLRLSYEMCRINKLDKNCFLPYP